MSYARLKAHSSKLHRLTHARSMLQWDAMAMAAGHGGPARAAACAELDMLSQQWSTEGWISDAIGEAAKELAAMNANPTGALDAGNLREMRRALVLSQAVDPELVGKRSTASSECLRVWGPSRAKNDWESFKPQLETMVSLAREEASQLAPAVAEMRGVDKVEKYEALAEQFEPGVTTETLDAMFTALDKWLPDAIASVVAKQKATAEVEALASTKVDLAKQEAFLRSLLPDLGFDLDHGRFDVIKGHPFCGGVPEDVRITTRLSETDFVTGLMGVIHETGHARYEQGRPREWVDQPIGSARSIGIHESQSLFFEMQIGRSAEFVRGFLAPRMQAAGLIPDLSAETLLALYRRVLPGKIRVDADELTYPMHVALRYKLERALVNGDIEVAELPDLWCAAMKDKLGVELSAEDRFSNGCMQDMHWAHGAFGYFPTYAIGAAAASQLMAAAKSELGADEVSTTLSNGDVAPLAGWLQKNVWDQASLPLTGDELLMRATGSALEPTAYEAHLRARYVDAQQ